MRSCLFRLRLAVFLCSILTVCQGIGGGDLRAAPAAPAQSLYSAALMELNAGNLQAALEHIQEAISLEPGNLEYQYSLGAVYMRMHRLEEAEVIYATLLREDPAGFRKAYFDLASIYLQRQEDRKALEVLEQARPVDPGRADFETGLIYMRRREYARAAELFEGARLHKPELAAESMIQQAIAFTYLKELGKARDLLAEVSRLPLSPGKQEEVRLLMQSVEAAARLYKPWQFIATLGAQYDNNLYQNPLEEVGLELLPQGVRDQEDFAFLVSLTGRYNLLQKDPWKVGVSYNHYQLNYLDHSDLNLIGARPSVYVGWESTPIFAYLEYLYSHYWVDGSSRVNVHSILPRLVTVHGDRWRTESYGGIEWRGYVDNTPDSNHYFLGFTQMYLLRDGKAHIRAGYRFDFDDLVPGERADYQTHELLLGILWPVWKDKWFLDVSGRQIWRIFDFDPNISLDEERDDSEQNVSAMLIGQILPNVQLAILFQYIWNDSDVEYDPGYDPFNYERAVTTWMITFHW